MIPYIAAIGICLRSDFRKDKRLNEIGEAESVYRDTSPDYLDQLSERGIVQWSQEERTAYREDFEQIFGKIN